MKLSPGGDPNAWSRAEPLLTAYREKSPLDDLSPVCSGRDILKSPSPSGKDSSEPAGGSMYLWQTLPRQQDEIRLGAKKPPGCHR